MKPFTAFIRSEKDSTPGTQLCHPFRVLVSETLGLFYNNIIPTGSKHRRCGIVVENMVLVSTQNPEMVTYSLTKRDLATVICYSEDKYRVMKKTLLLIIVICICAIFQSGKLYAQDPYFSQYFSSPMNLNPALTGSGVSDWRLMGAYRSQSMGEGTKPYTTMAVSLEKNLFAGTMRKDRLGLGGMIMSEASNGGLLKHNFLSAAIGYSNSLDAAGKHNLAGGISFSFATRVLDATNFLFQSQFGSGGYQSVIPMYDDAPITNRTYIDVNAGLMYSIKNERSGFYAGIGYFHANKPNDGIYTTTIYQVNPRLNAQMGYRKTISDNSELQFSSVYESQGEISRVSAGLIYKLGLGTGINSIALKSVNIGLWNRVGESYVPYIGLDGQNWLLGFSYDVPTGKLAKSFSNMQSFELSFGILLGKKNEDKEVFVY